MDNHEKIEQIQAQYEKDINSLQCEKDGILAEFMAEIEKEKIEKLKNNLQ